ncbi:50S ribosomal protein L30 [Deltaproteobacteria bacterium PRO3]|nr:50S ribosomal protein L30 [Deltaproteobacteria bacterium PRO3]
MAGFLKVEMIHSAIARDQRQKDTLRGLGLRRRHQQRILEDTPAVRGMIRKVFDLVRFEPVAGKPVQAAAVVTYKLGPKPDAAQVKVSRTQARKAARLAAAAQGEAPKKSKTAKSSAAKAEAAKPAKAAKKAPAKKSKG